MSFFAASLSLVVIEKLHDVILYPLKLKDDIKWFLINNENIFRFQNDFRRRR